MKNLALLLVVAAVATFTMGQSAGVALSSSEDVNGFAQYGPANYTAALTGGGALVGSQEYNDGSLSIKSYDDAAGGGTFGAGVDRDLWTKNAAGNLVGRTDDDNGNGAPRASTTSVFQAGYSLASSSGGGFGGDTYTGTAGTNSSAMYDTDSSRRSMVGVSAQGVGPGGQLTYAQFCQLLNSINPSSDVTSADNGDDVVTVSITGATVNGERIDFERGDLTVQLHDYANVSFDQDTPTGKMFVAWLTDQLDAVRARGEEEKVGLEINGGLNVDTTQIPVALGDTDTMRERAGLE